MGFPRVQVLRHVALPQALRVTIAPTVSNFIGAVKDTSLVAIVNIYDITGSLKMAMSDPHWIAYFVEMYMVVCTVYLLIGLGIARYGHLQGRSEEHTSELQSHSDLVCRLLLEKKKKKLL